MYVIIKEMRIPSRETRNATWTSCCFRLDKRCVMFSVQTFIGIALLTFCAYRLTTEPECDRAAPYWGLIGTIMGFFFNKMSMSTSTGRGGDMTRDSAGTTTRRDSRSRYVPTPVVINVP